MPGAPNDMLAVTIVAAVAAGLLWWRWSDLGWAVDLERFATWRAERHEKWSRWWLDVRRWALGRW